MRNHFVQRLTEIAKQDDRIILITGDLGFGVLNEFEELFPDRYINAGVAEQNMTGIATGLGMEGKVVFTYSIGNFCTLRCLEQIRNDACYHDANVNIVSVGGGFSYGQLGYSHHATEDIAIMRALPNLQVIAPGCFWETVQATDQIVNTPGVSYLRIDKSSAGYTGMPGEEFKLGKARVLKEGNDFTIITCGGILGEVLEAHDALAEEGINCRIVSMHTIKPIDEQIILDSARNTGGILTVEEHTLEGGLGGAVAEKLMDQGILPQQFSRLGLKDKFSTVVGSQQYLREQYGLDKQSIIGEVKKQVRKTSKINEKAI